MNPPSRLLTGLLLATLLQGCQPSSRINTPSSSAASPAGTAAIPVTATPSTGAAGSPTVSSSSSPAAGVAVPDETKLTLRNGSNVRTLTRAELLALPSLETITIKDLAIHRDQTVTYQAVPVTDLFEGMNFKPGDTIEFDTTDGFSSSLDPGRLLNKDPKGALAYVAIEDPAHPWVKLKNGVSAGPFYLVWKNAELSKIGAEEWPYQLASFTVGKSLETRFPAIQPDPALPAGAPERLGYELFVRSCFACHTLNGEGNGRVGPDLNQPHSPTEYLKEEYFRKFVRNPQDLRHWKGSRMSPFPPDLLPEADLDLIITYLKHKAEQRRAQSG